MTKSKKLPAGNYPIGYARPPAEHRVKKGQVLNPHGRNGKPKAKLDPFEEAMAQQATLIIGGKRVKRTAEQVIFLQQSAKASKGDTPAFNALARERYRRQLKGPQPPTVEEFLEETRQTEQRKINADRFFHALDELRAKAKQPEFSIEAEQLNLIECNEDGEYRVTQWARDAAEARRKDTS